MNVIGIIPIPGWLNLPESTSSNNLGKSQYGVQGCAQLVADIGQKQGFGTIGHHGFIFGTPQRPFLMVQRCNKFGQGASHFTDFILAVFVYLH